VIVRLGLPVLLASWLLAGEAAAGPWAATGDSGLRADLLTLADAGIVTVPVNTWPLPWRDIILQVRAADPAGLPLAVSMALTRVRMQARSESLLGGFTTHARLSASERGRAIRGFEDTPRTDAEAEGAVSFTGRRTAFRLNATAFSPDKGDSDVRADGSYFALMAGNWIASAGYQERWWGPGWDGSLILSTNARPPPQLALSRHSSKPVERRPLRWLGSWNFTTFMAQLDDDRIIPDTLLFGARFAFRPVPSLEVGLSRTAQWCGDGRPCSLESFGRVLAGKDNRGINVDESKEPGNQLGGVDLRWSPRWFGHRSAAYMQWIGEDTRQGGPQIGAWLRQLGAEWSGTTFADRWRQRSYIEVSETICRTGGTGFSRAQPNCAYRHSIYRSGYRYQGRAIGHGMDGDGQGLSVGTVLQASDGRSWQLAARRLEINTIGSDDLRHSISPTPQDIAEVTAIHERRLGPGRLDVGLGYRDISDEFDAARDGGSFFGWIGFAIR